MHPAGVEATDVVAMHPSTPTYVEAGLLSGISDLSTLVPFLSALFIAFLSFFSFFFSSFFLPMSFVPCQFQALSPAVAGQNTGAGGTHDANQERFRE